VFVAAAVWGLHCRKLCTLSCGCFKVLLLLHAI
jgi:hypothetical protein